MSGVSSEPPTVLFTIDQYERMVGAGVLAEDARVELIEGRIIEMAPTSPQHSTPVRRLLKAFATLGERAVLIVQDSIRLFPRSEPQPDVVLAKPPEESYVARHPEASDLLLVVEVSHTTQRFDRGTKVPLYARYGIPEVWVVDATAATIEVYRSPTGGRYATVETFERGQTVSPEAFPDLRLDVDFVVP
jgi:Uma2 family endonuclease